MAVKRSQRRKVRRSQVGAYPGQRKQQKTVYRRPHPLDARIDELVRKKRAAQFVKSRTDLSSYQDRRRRTARIEDRTTQGRAAGTYYLARLGFPYFKDPIRTVVCKARRLRRRILFMKKQAGKGKGPNPRRRRNHLSKVRC